MALADARSSSEVRFAPANSGRSLR